MPVEITDQLPSTLRELLAVALHDLYERETDPAYIIDMKLLHKPTFKRDGLVNSPTCACCLAGATLKRCGFSPTLGGEDEYIFTAVPETLRNKLYAIDHLRRGDLNKACGCLKIELPRFLAKEVSVVEYGNDRDKFFSDMQEIYETLRHYNL